MKIKNNYKLSIILSVMAISANYFWNISLVVMWYFWSLALLSIIVPKFGIFIYNFLCNFISRFLLFFVWICTVCPTGIIMKIFKRDRLKLKKTNLTSYWIDNGNTDIDYEYQF